MFPSDMKSRITILLIFVLFGFRTESLAENVEKPIRDLGGRLVRAIRNDDIVSYAHCWTSTNRMNTLLKSSKKAISPEDLDRVSLYFDARNRQIAHSFGTLSGLLKAQGKLEDLKLVEVTISGSVRDEDGLKIITKFFVTVSLGESKYTIVIDDGVQDNGTWFFTDKPLHVQGGTIDGILSLQTKDKN